MRMLGTLALALVGGAVLSAFVLPPSDSGTTNPFAFFEPTVRVSAADRVRLDNGEVIARTLPADDGHLAFFAASRLNARPDALIEWTRAIERLKRGPLVLAVGRFSERIDDDELDTLILEKAELDALKRCRVGSCDLKLAASEINALQDVIRAAGADWRQAAQREFRRLVIARVRLHRDRGLVSLPPYASAGGQLSVGEAFSSIAARSPYLTQTFPELINSLLMPGRAVANQEAFYYWSRDRYGAGKTVVTITHVRLLQSERTTPQALTVSTTLYASHYIDGALGVSAVVCDEAATSCYLTYLNRTRVDLLGGFFGPLKRSVIERRIESDAPDLMRGIAQRLERNPADSEGGES